MIKNIAIFISGRGSNMKSLIEDSFKQGFPSNIALVLSDSSDALGLEFAQEKGIATVVSDRKSFSSKRAFEHHIQETLKVHHIDFICLAGFVQLLSADFCQHWEGRIINIHPSLLPAFKGLDTHQRALDAGAAFAGCTIHYVTPEMDSGHIIAQAGLYIQSEDTAETLSQRVLCLEHILYPKVLRQLCLGYTENISFFEGNDG